MGRTDFAAMKEAVVMGSALASVTCEAFGTEGIQSLGREKLEERVGAFRKMTEWQESLGVPA
jgi:hypothetical protein